MIPNKPMLKRNYKSILMPKGAMQLRNEENVLMLKGATVADIIEKMLPLLDGNNTIDDIMQSFTEYSRDTIVSVIEMLQNHYVIEDGDGINQIDLSKDIVAAYSDQINYLSLFSERIVDNNIRISKYDIFKSIYQKTCFVIGSGKVATAMVRELASNGIGKIILSCKEDFFSSISAILSQYFKQIKLEKREFDEINENSGIDMVILAEDIITDAQSRKVNKRCIDNNIPWMSLNIGETRFEVGPLVVPHETACYSCYMNRLNGNSTHFEEETSFRNYKNLETNSISIFAYDTMIRVAAGIAAWEIIKYLSKIFSCVTTGRVIHFNILSLEMKSHTILKMPKCKVCSKVETLPFSEPYAVYLP